ncbi:hypothetical protein LJC01_03440 [Clostridiaceae bacterium OttesenSCG-928-D20]|nr:hypothetical protein [Clostridiaceae bacterium OttesenSCG-928-D20]
MKRKLIAIILALLAFSLLAACSDAKDEPSTSPDATIEESPSPDPVETETPEPEESETPEPEPEDDDALKNGTIKGYDMGIVDGNVYESEWMNLRFTAPEEFTMSTTEELLALISVSLDAALKDENDKALFDAAAEKSVYEMMATHSMGAPNIIVMAEQIPNGMSEKSYMAALKNSLDLVEMDYVFSELYTTEVAGIEFTALDMDTTASGIEMKQTMLVSANGDRAYIMSLTYFDAADKDTMLNCFEALS